MRLIALVFVVLVASVSHAQPIKEAPAKQDAAAGHFRLGVDFYRAGDYPAARVEFEAAYGLSQAPDLLHNLSLTAEQQGRYAEAIDYEERWLAAAREALSPEEVDQARGRLLRLRERQATPATRAEPPSTPSKAPSPAKAGWRPPAGAIGLLAAGGAVLVGGIACGAAALDTSAQLHSGQAFTLREIEALNGRGQALNGAAIGLDTVGGVAIVGGALWLVLDWKRSRDRVGMGLKQPTLGRALDAETLGMIADGK